MLFFSPALETAIFIFLVIWPLSKVGIPDVVSVCISAVLFSVTHFVVSEFSIGLLFQMLPTIVLGVLFAGIFCHERKISDSWQALVDVTLIHSVHNLCVVLVAYGLYGVF